MNWIEETVAYALTYRCPKGFGVKSKVLYPISKRLVKTEGVCPCHHKEWNEHTPLADKQCPCKTFRDTGECHCGLYVKL